MLKTYTIPEASELTGIPKTALYRAIKDGRLAAKRRRGTKRGWRVTEEMIEEYWNGLEVSGEEKKEADQKN